MDHSAGVQKTGIMIALGSRDHIHGVLEGNKDSTGSQTGDLLCYNLAKIMSIFSLHPENLRVLTY